MLLGRPPGIQDHHFALCESWHRRCSLYETPPAARIGGTNDNPVHAGDLFPGFAVAGKALRDQAVGVQKTLQPRECF
jgi:hypothetical protein